MRERTWKCRHCEERYTYTEQLPYTIRYPYGEEIFLCQECYSRAMQYIDGKLYEDEASKSFVTRLEVKMDKIIPREEQEKIVPRAVAEKLVEELVKKKILKFNKIDKEFARYELMEKSNPEKAQAAYLLMKDSERYGQDVWIAEVEIKTRNLKKPRNKYISVEFEDGDMKIRKE